MSKIQVDAIEQQTACGTTLTAGGGAGKTVVVDATTVTLGRCGGTVALASGASQTGFGRTGTVNWDTTPKTGTFTAVSGVGYFADTSSTAFNMNLPAGVAGAIVSVADYTRTFQTNNLTIVPNGSEKIGGVVANLIASTEGQSITLVYVDATEGWINTAESTGQTGLAAEFISASVSGACNTLATVDTNYKVATFVGPGTFTVCSVGNPLGSTTVDYLVVGGGGAGPSSGGGDGITGGGGGGGFRFYANPTTNPQSGPGSPLNGPAAIPVSVQGYTIVVGGGGPRGSGPGGWTPGVASSGLGITSAGGGRGGRGDPTANGQTGGSGGGGSNTGSAGAGNTPPVSPSQGNPGGAGSNPYATGGGGGGAIVAAVPITGPRQGIGGAGGGLTGFGTSGQSSGGQYYFSGGGGGAYNGPTPAPGAAGGIGGGGSGGYSNACGNAGTANTGGGGGGASDYPGGNGGGNGGSGIVIIRYKFQ